MPCYDPRDDDWRWNRQQHDDERNALVAKLCHACATLETNGLLPVELQQWWTYHKTQDELRRQQDAKKAEAAMNRKARREYLESIRERLRTQLTDDEQEALGLDAKHF